MTQMPSANPSSLSADQLRRRTQLTAKSPASDERVLGFLGQARAREAIELAASITSPGFNLYIAAPPGTLVRKPLRRVLSAPPGQTSPVNDWVYVYNFAEPHAPLALKLPRGAASRARETVRSLLIDLRAAIPAAFDKPDVQGRTHALEDQFKDKQEDAFEALGEKARAENVAIRRTPMGFSISPMKDGEIMPPEAIKALSEDDQAALQKSVEDTHAALGEIIRQIPQWEKELRDALRDLQKKTVEAAITALIDDARKSLSDVPVACQHLEAIREDLVENVDLFTGAAMAAAEAGVQISDDGRSLGVFDRYDINVLVGHTGNDAGMPIVEESHPTLANLIGKVEYRAEDGMLSTSFQLIKPGALHLANGGYLLLDARALLLEPMSWQALKRALTTGCVKIESLAEALNLSSTITLDPAPIPLDIKIVLIGDAWIYHMLAANDPDFTEHFKLLADFEADAPRTKESERDYAAWLVSLAKDRGLLEPDKAAQQRLVEEAARLSGHGGKLSLASDALIDLMAESSHHAQADNRRKIQGRDVGRAIEAKNTRMGRIRDRMQEQLLSGVSLVDTDGVRIGQINGLSVFQFGSHTFGKPSRITSRVRPGRGQIIDIERETKLGGPIHSKGVLILTGYLSGTYALDRPMSLSASLVLEQSYGGVEGDSASLGELVAILSALSELPINQSLAITGAINQFGDVQAIGGVNEKIEGFFDLCSDRGLTGEQGVIIPQSNVQHLMLREDIVAACRADTFRIYAVESVDEALHLMLGTNPQLCHEKIEARLSQFADVYSAVNGSVRPAQSLPDRTPGLPPVDVPSDPPRQPPIDPEEPGTHNGR